MHSLEGGLRAWQQGMLAEGIPRQSRLFTAPAATVEDFIALAWLLEENTRRFYEEISQQFEGSEPSSLFHHLSIAEERHQSTLKGLREALTTLEPVKPFPGNAAQDDTIMEGDMRLEDALAWARGKSVRDIVELSIALETNAYDRYILMSREAGDEPSRQVFSVLAQEEKHHLERLADLFDTLL